MSDLPVAADLMSRLSGAQPRLAELIAASSQRLALRGTGPRGPKRLERLMIAARTLGAERRIGPRMPFRHPVRLALSSGVHCATSIDLGRHGMMLERPASAMAVDGVSARIEIASLGIFPAQLVAIDEHSLSLAFDKMDANQADTRLMRLITALERQNADAIAVSVRFATEVSEAFAQALTARKTSVADLFASGLRRIAETDPPQFDHPAMALFDELLPSIMLRYRSMQTGIAYAVATTRNCFVPIHNPELSQPQKPLDPAFNHAFSRHRRIYDDRWTLRAAAFSPHPVVQAYRRDVPECHLKVVREVSAPITINNRHWGAAQIGYLMANESEQLEFA